MAWSEFGQTAPSFLVYFQSVGGSFQTQFGVAPSLLTIFMGNFLGFHVPSSARLMKAINDVC